jgi:hypothetical protein
MNFSDPEFILLLLHCIDPVSREVTNIPDQTFSRICPKSRQIFTREIPKRGHNSVLKIIQAVRSNRI